MEILAQPLCETLLPLDPIVFTPTTFRHTKRLPIRISRPSHKKFHFKNDKKFDFQMTRVNREKVGVCSKIYVNIIEVYDNWKFCIYKTEKKHLLATDKNSIVMMTCN
jgi:hypothetical protein